EATPLRRRGRSKVAVHGPAQTPPPDDAHAPWSEGSVMDTISREPAISPTDTGAATFTKWMVGEGPQMAGTVGGSVGDGTYNGKVLDMSVGPTTPVEALYGFHGSEQEFTALVHIEQTGLEAVISGVVIDGF